MDLIVEHVDVWAANIKDQSGALAWVLTGLREAGADLAFNVTNCLHSVRIEGDNRPGVTAGITKKLGETGIHVRGFSAAVIGTRFIIYIALDTDATKAMDLLRQAQKT